MAYIFDDEFTVYKKDVELRISRNVSSGGTKIVVSDASGLNLSFTLSPTRELQKYSIKVDEINESFELSKGKWSAV